MGFSCSCGCEIIRVSHFGGSTGGTQLDDYSEEAGELSKRIRLLQPGKDRKILKQRREAPTFRHWHRRNRLKIMATITNARKFLEVQKEFGSFDSYIWKFTQGRPIKHRFRTLSAIPAKSKESDAMSGDLQKRGFKFVGSTICYAFMQAVGIVNDHTVNCFRYGQV